MVREREKDNNLFIENSLSLAVREILYVSLNSLIIILKRIMIMIKK